MLIERITLTGHDYEVMRELAPEITLRSVPAYNDYDCNVLQVPHTEPGSGCSHTRPTPNSDEV